MSEKVTIYLAGAVSHCATFEEANRWRMDAAYDLTDLADSSGACVRIINPCSFYSPFDNRHQSEMEAMKFDLVKVHGSDLVIVNLDKINTSIGTAIELYEAWRDGIPVLALDYGNEYEHIHPWLKCCITRVEKDHIDLMKYISEFYFI